MFAFRHVRDGEADGQRPVDLAFTDRGAPGADLDLTLGGPVVGDETAHEVLQRLAGEFSPWAASALPIGMRQVHGADVRVVDTAYDGSELVADALVTDVPGVTLLVRAADCVPLLLVSAENDVVGAVHCGRPGVVAGVVPAAVAAMRDLGATVIHAWVGPHVCGACYEVPEEMRSDVAAVVPQAWAETSWGTPSVDIGAAVLAQLDAADVAASSIDRCTYEDAGLWSHRREGPRAGRLGGLVRIRA